MKDIQAFSFYRSFWEQFKLLSAEESFELLSKMCTYVFEGIDIENSSKIVALLWLGIKPQIDASLRKYWILKENGKKGGRPKKQNETKQKPNEKQDKTKIEPNQNQDESININIIDKYKNENIINKNVVDITSTTIKKEVVDDVAVAWKAPETIKSDKVYEWLLNESGQEWKDIVKIQLGVHSTAELESLFHRFQNEIISQGVEEEEVKTIKSHFTNQSRIYLKAKKNEPKEDRPKHLKIF